MSFRNTCSFVCLKCCWVLELRLWKREYMNLLDLADVKRPEDAKASFFKYVSVKITQV
jgi:hypothetical protein